MNRKVLAGFVPGCVLIACIAQAQTLPSQITSIAFLIGAWSGTSRVDGDLKDRSTISVQLIAGGNALLLRNHDDVTDSQGKLQQSYDQVMLVYPEGGTVHAEFVDGAHTVHYRQAQIEPGRSVQFFLSANAKGTPAFRLTYTMTSVKTLSMKIETAEARAFRTISEHVVTRE